METKTKAIAAVPRTIKATVYLSVTASPIKAEITTIAIAVQKTVQNLMEKS